MTTVKPPYMQTLKSYFDAPPSWLTPWIDEVWQTQPTAQPTSALILPDNCMDLVFTDAQCKVVGASTLAYEVAIGAHASVWGVRFKPGILPILLDLDARDVLNDAFLHQPPSIENLHHRWAKRLDDAQTQTVILSALEQSRLLNVEQIAQRLGWTTRHLQRKLPPLLGYTLKTWCRVNRLRRFAQESLNSPLAQVASRCGYADQPHMTRECKRLTGYTPMALNAKLHTLNASR